MEKIANTDKEIFVFERENKSYNRIITNKRAVWSLDYAARFLSLIVKTAERILPRCRSPPFDFDSIQQLLIEIGGILLSIYYFENENGTFFSEDGKRRFIRLSGKEAYDYMRENKSGDSYFVQTVTDDTEDGEKVFVEVPKSSVSVYRGGTYHAQYLSKMRKKKRYRLVSLYHPTEDGDGTAVVDKYSDDGHTVEDAVIREINLEILRRALKSLTDDELKIVRSLYLDENPMSERQLSRIMDIPVTTLDYRKKQVLKKLKNFFEKT